MDEKQKRTFTIKDTLQAFVYFVLEEYFSNLVD